MRQHFPFGKIVWIELYLQNQTQDKSNTLSIIDRYITIESLAYKPIALENVPTHRTEGFCFILPLLPVGNPNLASYFPFQTLGFEMPLPSHIYSEVHKYIFC